jgi:hypothetical protein
VYRRQYGAATTECQPGVKYRMSRVKGGHPCHPLLLFTHQAQHAPDPDQPGEWMPIVSGGVRTVTGCASSSRGGAPGEDAARKHATAITTPRPMAVPLCNFIAPLALSACPVADALTPILDAADGAGFQGPPRAEPRRLLPGMIGSCPGFKYDRTAVKHRPSPARVVLIFALPSAALTAGCTLWPSGPSSLRITSESAIVEPALRTAVYRAEDENTADIFLSDLEPEELVDRLRNGVEGQPGFVIHLHMFLQPKAGRTPIDFTASNTALTKVVLTGSLMGVYGGGGFVLPRSAVGDSRFTGRIDGATIRLITADDGFADMLGPSVVSGSVAAARNDELAESISDALTRMLRR